jgi:putative oxidoreductase
MEKIINNKPLFDVNKSTNISLFLIRVTIGIIFFLHGLQKVFGSFGGSGLKKWNEYLKSSFKLPEIVGYISAISEMIFGIFLIAGLFTRISSLIMIIFMLFATFMVHWKNGFFITNKGYEYCLLIIVCLISLTIMGGGEYSVDSKFIFKEK